MEKVSHLFEEFGIDLFDKPKIKQYVSEATYLAYEKALKEHTPLSDEVISEMAEAMKTWAISRGATHYSHWFQPLSGVTAEKHESFINPNKDNAILKFSKNDLLKSETDASSFPSGGLRSTFEARGFSSWDLESFAFIRDNILYIPTLFSSYSLEALDKKIPLSRSEKALDKSVCDFLHELGFTETNNAKAKIGIEQEYFLIKKADFEKREDIKLLGRTLFGSSIKKQEYDYHYYGAIKPEIKSFMLDLDKALWKVGVYAKTEHNEVAPCQYELASVFGDANIANDQNQIVMEMLKNVAEKHNLVCLLNEKPFKGVNGSGKHINYSIISDNGMNLFENKKGEEVKFLLTMAALIKGVDDYPELLRLSTANASNDNRLGGEEAPPSMISIYLGKKVIQMIEDFISLDKEVRSKSFADDEDRNRTSPLAFVGNRIEFRMPGSSQSVATPVTYLNTILAEEFALISQEIKAHGKDKKSLQKIIKDIYDGHKRIIYNDNGYSEEWKKEAARRGLVNLPNTLAAIPCQVMEKNISLLTRHDVYSEVEIRSRNEIHVSRYIDVISLEARTMNLLINTKILPSLSKYGQSLGENSQYEKDQKKMVNEATDALYLSNLSLASDIEKIRIQKSKMAQMEYCSDVVKKEMDQCRKIIDDIENKIDRTYWPFPTYIDILF